MLEIGASLAIFSYEIYEGNPVRYSCLYIFDRVGELLLRLCSSAIPANFPSIWSDF